MDKLQEQYKKEIAGQVSEKTLKRNEILGKEIYLSVGRFNKRKRSKLAAGLRDALKEAMKLGVDLDDEAQRNAVFDNVAFRVRYLDETADQLHGTCILNLASIRDAKDWTQIRGKRIATVFQDPMTSLNYETKMRLSCNANTGA